MCSARATPRRTAPLCADGAAPAKRPPNILFIFSDDHGSQAISAYGSVLNKTPNIDRIAAEGMRFDNCFCTNSICAPSRAVILTGGTGIAPRDVTPESVEPLLERLVPGFGEIFRALSYEEIGSAALLSPLPSPPVTSKRTASTRTASNENS